MEERQSDSGHNVRFLVMAGVVVALAYEATLARLAGMAKAKRDERPVDIKTKVRGISFGTNPKHAKKCRAGDRLALVREPRNEHDRNAIAVYRRGWLFKKMIGHLSAEIAADLAPRMDGGLRIWAVVLEVTGRGWFSSKNIGVNIHVQSA